MLKATDVQTQDSDSHCMLVTPTSRTQMSSHPYVAFGLLAITPTVRSSPTVPMKYESEK